MPIWRQTYFMSPQTYIALNLYNYHNCVMVLGSGIVSLVGFALFMLVIAPYKLKWGGNIHMTEHNTVEFIWTVIPFVLLMIFCFFSLNNLSKMELGDNIEMKVGVVGHQWYWEYQYILNAWSNAKDKKELLSLLVKDWDGLYGECLNLSWTMECNMFLALKKWTLVSDAIAMKLLWSYLLKSEWMVNYNSYLVQEEDLSLSSCLMFRNMDVSQPCLMSVDMKHEMSIMTADVMHSWGVAAFAAKADAVPGRTNSLSVKPIFPGMVYGFCYELCGVGHSAMPIGVMVTENSMVDMLLKGMVLESVMEN